MSPEVVVDSAAANPTPTKKVNSDDQQQDQNERPDIILNSPVGGKPAIFKYTLANSDEIIETIRWVSREYREFKPAIDNLIADIDLTTYEDVKDLCDRYNKITGYVNKMNKGTSIALKTSSRASQGLLKHIMHQVYNYAVVDPEKLNQYAPFSSEVYGETSFAFVAQMIDDNRTRPQEKDTFIDLGSGVGQVVLQVAASVECKKCYGIEKADVPAHFAQEMEDRFRFWMDWFGKTYTEFEIFHGDFFENRFTEIIKESTHLFINNFAFKPEVDHKLKLKFIDLKEGTRIISSKQFCPTRSRVTERDLSDIGSIMHVIEIQPEQKKDTVSWTDKQVPYYLHTLDGTRVEKYYERRRKERTEKQFEQEGRRKRSTGNSSQSSPDSTKAPIKTNKVAKKPTKKIADRTNKAQKAPPLTEASEQPAPRKRSEKEKKIDAIVTVKTPKRRRRSQSASTDTEICSIDQLQQQQQPQQQQQRVKHSIPTENTQPVSVITSGHAVKAGNKRRRKSTAAVSSLELLHEKTVESNSIDFSHPAPGCVDHSLTKTVTSSSLFPNIIINDLSMFLVGRNMNKLFDGLKQEFDKFVEAIKKPNMRESLLREIQREKDRKRELMYAHDNLTKHIKVLADRANRATGAHCDQLGIANSNKSLIAHLGVLLNKHQELAKQASHLGAHIILPGRQPPQPPLVSPQISHQQMNPPPQSQSVLTPQAPAVQKSAPPQINPPVAHAQTKTSYPFTPNKPITSHPLPALHPLLLSPRCQTFAVPLDRRAKIQMPIQSLPHQTSLQYYHHKPNIIHQHNQQHYHQLSPSTPQALYQQQHQQQPPNHHHHHHQSTTQPVTLDLSKKGRA